MLNLSLVFVFAIGVLHASAANTFQKRHFEKNEGRGVASLDEAMEHANDLNRGGRFQPSSLMNGVLKEYGPFLDAYICDEHKFVLDSFEFIKCMDMDLVGPAMHGAKEMEEGEHKLQTKCKILSKVSTCLPHIDFNKCYAKPIIEEMLAKFFQQMASCKAGHEIEPPRAGAEHPNPNAEQRVLEAEQRAEPAHHIPDFPENIPHGSPENH